MRGCGKGGNPLQDSVNVYKKINDTLKAQTIVLSKANDSVINRWRKDTSTYRHRIDSLTRVTQTLKVSFLHTRDTIANLHNRLDSAFAANDTAGVWDIADSLNNELTKANNLLFAWQISRDSNDTTKDHQIDELNTIVVSLQEQIVQYKLLLKECTDNSANLSKTANSAIKKSKLNSLWGKIGTGLAAVLAILLIAK